jgi:SPP1 family predicted phage head-tail adaptor
MTAASARVTTGQFNRRVTLRVRNVTRGAYGEEIVAWDDLATVWANIREGSEASLRSVESADGTRQEVTQRPVRVLIHYRADVLPDMLVYMPDRARSLQIKSVAELGRLSALELICVEFSA